MNTERLAERETLLHRLGSKLNRTVLNSCGNPIIRSGKTRDFCAEPVFFCEQSHSHQKRSQKWKLTIFGTTKQVIQDYDTVFDNSIPFRKNDPLRILECSVPGLPTLEVEWKSETMRNSVPKLPKAESCVERLVGGWASPGRRG